jgi:CheY-like chemotaxis protein
MTKILLVEDDKSLREIYGVRLLAEGYDIVSAGDGEEALAMAIKEKPTLIVSDVMMPKISGFDMLDILRSTTETRDIKVIMMTALSSDDQRARGEQLGADRYLVKSQVGIEDVVRTVHEVLGDASAAAPAAPAPQEAPVATPAPDDDLPDNGMPAPLPIQPTIDNEPAATTTESTLPQPTAPFSSPRPATLGERVINPIESAEPTVTSSVKSQIEQELQAPVEPVTATQVDEAVSDEAAVDPSKPLATAEPAADVTQPADDAADASDEDAAADAGDDTPRQSGQAS